MKKKSKFQKRLDDALEQHKKEKNIVTPSKFQQRLNKLADDRIERRNEVNAHIKRQIDNSLDRSINDPSTITAQWIYIKDEKPPYYASVDIDDGVNIMEDWQRVSDGDNDYYVNNRNMKIVPEIIKWRKRPGVSYETYTPLITQNMAIKQVTMKRYDEPFPDPDVIPVLSANDVKGIIKIINKLIDKREKSNIPSINYTEGMTDAISIIETTLIHVQKDK